MNQAKILWNDSQFKLLSSWIFPSFRSLLVVKLIIFRKEAIWRLLLCFQEVVVRSCFLTFPWPKKNNLPINWHWNHQLQPLDVHWMSAELHRGLQRFGQLAGEPASQFLPFGLLQVTQVLVGHVLLPPLIHLLGCEPLDAIQNRWSAKKTHTKN